MKFGLLEQWLSRLGKKGHNILALDEVGNLALLSENPGDDPACRVVVNWKDIHINDPLQRTRFSSLIRSCYLSDNAEGVSLTSPVMLRSEAGNEIHIDAVPIPAKLRIRLHGARSLLYFREVEHHTHCATERPRQSFDLTAAESSVAIMIAEGYSLKSISSKLDISIWTARSHLRSIFQKTNTHRQAELVSLLAHSRA